MTDDYVDGFWRPLSLLLSTRRGGMERKGIEMNRRKGHGRLNQINNCHFIGPCLSPTESAHLDEGRMRDSVEWIPQLLQANPIR